jgi:ornithine decarboxylase
VLRGGRSVEEAEQAFTVFGPTCDSLDRLPKPIPLAGGIRAGDFVEFGLIGAYSLSNRTAFNGIYPDRFARIDSESLPPGFSGA